MGTNEHANPHSAGAIALGFYYQAFYALETLLAQTADDAAVSVERLDDVELTANGQTLLYQLKHSISTTPPPISLKARALWRTIAVWIDLLPSLTLADTTLHLVAVGEIPDNSELYALEDVDADRTKLISAMTKEAQRVVDAREHAHTQGKTLPYSDRVDGCSKFLLLSENDRFSLIRRILICKNSPTIDQIEDRIANRLTLIKVDERPSVASRLIEWWDREIVYSLCGKRDRAVSRIELQAKYMSTIRDLEENKLIPAFEVATPPDDYQPNGMLTRQVQLVSGSTSDLEKAIREEWRAREQRSRWANDNPAMSAIIYDYDLLLREHWSDKHTQMSEESTELEDDAKCLAGRAVLRWSHDQAPQEVRPIGIGWTAAYYVRGSYQVLAINRHVGWHPNFFNLLESDE